jgi:hypothetical protein
LIEGHLRIAQAAIAGEGDQFQNFAPILFLNLNGGLVLNDVIEPINNRLRVQPIKVKRLAPRLNRRGDFLALGRRRG